MRVGLDVHVLTGPHQGTTSVWMNLLNELPASHEYVLYSFDPVSVAGMFPQSHFLHRRIPKLPAAARIQFAFPLLARRDGCDVFHSTYYGPLIWGPPVVLYVHDVIYIDFPEFSTGARRAMFATLGRASAHAARAVVTLTEWGKSRIVELYGVADNKVRVIPPGLERAWVNPSLDLLDKAWDKIRSRVPARYAMTVGRLDPRKNFAQTARVTRALVQRGLLDGLVIVGPEDFGTGGLRDELRRDGTEGIVTHLTGLDTPTLQAVYRNAECLTYLSLAEGFGMPLVEAMAMGTPIVASNRTCIPEVTGDAGLVVNPDETEQVVTSTAAILTEQPLRQRLINNGKRRLANFGAVEMAARMVDVYESTGRARGAR